MMSKSRVICALLLLVIASGCDRQEPAPSVKAESADSTVVPDAELRSAKIYLYDKGRITTEILAERLLKFEVKDSTLAFALEVTSFDSVGRVRSTLVGDSGLVREKIGYMEVFGNVVAVGEDSTRLETDYLQWDSQTDKIRSNKFVRITRANGDVISGVGMETDQKLSRIKVLTNVSGRVRDAERFTRPPDSNLSVPHDTSSDSMPAPY